MLVKFCGAVTEDEAVAAAGAGADLLGLWYAVPGGPAELSAGRLTELAAATRATGRTEPVLVTFSHDAEDLLRVLAGARTAWVQLHGFQPPSVVRRLRRGAGPGLRIVKVLHVDDAGRCPEEGLLRGYERAGADLFLFDAVGPGGRLGSTARALDPAAVVVLAGRTDLPFLLAGGLHAGNHGPFAPVRELPGFAGIDVDSAARGPARPRDRAPPTAGPPPGRGARPRPPPPRGVAYK
ncbi:N-(5'-phosphoribosyl)anthranilate isomerase, partial [Streptomyces sp. NPDC058861]|uniref:phosphoribosylanthranilate isomerase n=1 Tax=Streptomyces sp. NPDC058861 TaxID=3346653 RepID=UPI0036A9EB86